MVKVAALAALAATPLAAAFPAVMELSARLDAERAAMAKRTTSNPRKPLGSTGRNNLGPWPSEGVIFNAKEQLVDVSEGSGHEFQSPGPSDERGQCPGLNAAANHGYLPRNGIATTADTINGLGAAYNMAPDLALVLSVLSIALGGDPLAGTWSIGGGYPATLGLGKQPGGIISLHSKYEGDASIVRGDAYISGGRVNNFTMRSYEHLTGLMDDNGDNLSLDTVNGHNDYVQHYSIENNPYYFTGFFAGAVTPAAHNFVVNFMSNHSEEIPTGYLNKDILGQFFSVTGDKAGEYKHTYNQERIPENWYKRPTAQPYTLVNVFQDLLSGNSIYPGLIRFGGNTGKVNTFTGVDLENVTGGVVNAANLLEGNNLACFVLQASTANEPDLVEGAIDFVTKQLGTTISNLGCPQLKNGKNGIYGSIDASQYPGASYKGTGVSK